MKNEYFNGGHNPRWSQVRSIRSSRKERAPDREECQYVNCAMAETRWTRTSLMWESNKEKRENTKKEVERGRRKVEGGGARSNITTRPRLGWGSLFPWFLFAGSSARGYSFYRRSSPHWLGYFGFLDYLYCILLSSIFFFNIIIPFWYLFWFKSQRCICFPTLSPNYIIVIALSRSY